MRLWQFDKKINNVFTHLGAYIILTFTWKMSILQAINQFILAIYALLLADVKRTCGFISRNCTLRINRSSVKSAVNLSPIGTPLSYITKLTKVKNVLNATCVRTLRLRRDIWNRICWFTPNRNHLSASLATSLFDKNNC